MHFGKGNVLKAHVLRNIPEDLWYSNSHNGITRVALARQVELSINHTRSNLKPGPPKSHYDVFQTGYSPTFNFSDRIELMNHDDQGRTRRLQSGICGNMKEFYLFCFTFPVVPGPPIWIPGAEILRKADGLYSGIIGDHDSLGNILNLARECISWSSDRLKD